MYSSSILFHQKYSGGIPKVYSVDTIFSDFHINSDQAKPKPVRNPPWIYWKRLVHRLRLHRHPYLPPSRAPPPLVFSHHMHQPDGFEIPNDSVPTTSLLRNDAALPLLGGPSLFYSILPCREPIWCMERRTEYAVHVHTVGTVCIAEESESSRSRASIA